LSEEQSHKSLFSSSLFIFIIRFFSTLSSLVVIVYFSHTLPQAAYGQYQNFWVRLTVLGTIASAGLAVLAFTYSPATLRFLMQRIKSKYYALYVFFLLLFSLLFWLLTNSGTGMAYNSQVSVAAPLFFIAYVLNIIAEALLIIVKKFRFLLFLNLFHALAFVGVHGYAASGVFQLETLVRMLCILTIVKLVLFAGAIINSFRKEQVPVEAAVNTGGVRSLWLHIFFYDTSQILFRFLDKFIIAFIVSKELSAVYFNGTVDIPFLPIALTAISSAALMQLTRSTYNREHTIDVIRKSSILLATITFPVFFFLFFFREEFILFVFSDKYLASVPVFACALIKLPFYIFNVTFFLQYKQRGDIINKGALMDMVITLLLLYPMYNWLGLQGMVLSLVISSYIQVIYYMRCASRLLDVSLLKLLPVWNWLVKIVVFGLAALLLQYGLSHFFSATTRLLTGGISIAFISMLWVLYEYKSTGLVTFGLKKGH
jgi:O-antigen/teichoic acid export membrane protein